MSEHGVPAEADGVSSSCEAGARAAAAANGPAEARGAGVPRSDRADRADRAALVEAGSGAHAATDDGTGQERHLTREVLCRFMDGGLSPEEMRLTFRHLLRGCPSCRQQARKVWNLTLPGAAVAASAPPRTDRRAEPCV